MFFQGKNILQFRNLLKAGQTTTLCHAQDYVFLFLCLFGPGPALDNNQGLCFFFHVSHGEKLTRSNARKTQDSNANVDKFELKYKAVCRKNVVGVNA